MVTETSDVRHGAKGRGMQMAIGRDDALVADEDTPCGDVETRPVQFGDSPACFLDND